ncbi:hypothetical protein [Ruania rhizosphaerae]|uniref:hypothetical protein n=1 Tax=Ruania rhizosphaerae TaxID=1840413 RepID=UPI001359549E|nr:hypothetical protein [Ruania rhizosphaerae]
MSARWPRLRSRPNPPEPEPDDAHTVPVEQADGTEIYARPEAADHWRPEVWRTYP